MNLQSFNGKYKNYFFIESLKDLTDLFVLTGNAIEVPSDTTLFFPSSLDLEGNRLVCEHNTTILGSSSETSVLSSTLTNEPLITSFGTIKLRDISFKTTGVGSTILDIDGTGEPLAALDWFAVNFLDSNLGVIKNVSNFVAQTCGFLNSKELTFDGTFGSIVIDTCIFSAINSGTYIHVPATTIVNRRLRLENCPFVVLSGATGINVSTSASINVEAYIAKFCNFSGGGTYLTGVQPSDNKSLFFENRGVLNSASLTEYYNNSNTTPTVINTQGTFVKITTTTLPGVYSQKFTLTDNRATYDGAVTRFFRITAVLSASAGSNQVLIAKFAKNGVIIDSSQGRATTSGGSRAENLKCQTIVSLDLGDYIELWITNDTATTSVVVTDLNVIIESLN